MNDTNDTAQDSGAALRSDDAADSTGKNRRGWYWPFLIGGFLFTAAAADLIVMAIATNHPSIAIQEDYYEKGNRWFEEQATADASAQLGWTVELRAAPFVRSRNPLGIDLIIKDRDGNPVDLDHGIVSLFHVARPREIFRGEVDEIAAGTHHIDVKILQPGVHQIRLEASRGDDTFLFTTRTMIRTT